MMKTCTPDSVQIDVKQTEMDGGRLKAVEQNKVVIKIIVKSAICQVEGENDDAWLCVLMAKRQEWRQHSHNNQYGRKLRVSGFIYFPALSVYYSWQPKTPAELSRTGMRCACVCLCVTNATHR